MFFRSLYSIVRLLPAYYYLKNNNYLSYRLSSSRGLNGNESSLEQFHSNKDIRKGVDEMDLGSIETSLGTDFTAFPLDKQILRHSHSTTSLSREDDFYRTKSRANSIESKNYTSSIASSAGSNNSSPRNDSPLLFGTSLPMRLTRVPSNSSVNSPPSPDTSKPVSINQLSYRRHNHQLFRQRDKRLSLQISQNSLPSSHQLPIFTPPSLGSSLTNNEQHKIIFETDPAPFGIVSNSTPNSPLKKVESFGEFGIFKMDPTPYDVEASSPIPIKKTTFPSSYRDSISPLNPIMFTPKEVGYFEGKPFVEGSPPLAKYLMVDSSLKEFIQDTSKKLTEKKSISALNNQKISTQTLSAKKSQQQLALDRFKNLQSIHGSFSDSINQKVSASVVKEEKKIDNSKNELGYLFESTEKPELVTSGTYENKEVDGAVAGGKTDLKLNNESSTDTEFLKDKADHVNKKEMEKKLFKSFNNHFEQKLSSKANPKEFNSMSLPMLVTGERKFKSNVVGSLESGFKEYKTDNDNFFSLSDDNVDNVNSIINPQNSGIREIQNKKKMEDSLDDELLFTMSELDVGGEP
ncbi:hypothetical protein HK099_005154 [Clydaea vesicula]|uniref:Uncharacterized protein n=1 Tax=Clydaea vesicula TaxID=447962 RepID=A0AAD5U904_9FUNG|nr:hypothetical protein HK099_005154 [Clydaea vesicula]